MHVVLLYYPGRDVFVVLQCWQTVSTLPEAFPEVIELLIVFTYLIMYNSSIIICYSISCSGGLVGFCYTSRFIEGNNIMIL